jgi:hypothetical protein
MPNSSNNYGVEIDFFIFLLSFSFCPWPCPAARSASHVNQALAPMGKFQTSINLWAKITTFGFKAVKAAAAIVTNVIDAPSAPPPYPLARYVMM